MATRRIRLVPDLTIYTAFITRSHLPTGESRRWNRWRKWKIDTRLGGCYVTVQSESTAVPVGERICRAYNHSKAPVFR